MNDIIKKLELINSSEEEIEKIFQQYFKDTNKSLNFSIESDDDIRDFLMYYIPEVFSISDDEFKKLLEMIEDIDISKILLRARPINYTYEEILNLTENWDVLEAILLNQPEMLTQEIFTKIMDSVKFFPNFYLNFLYLDYVVDTYVDMKKNDFSWASLDFKTFENINLSEYGKKRIFGELNFSGEIPEKFLNDETIASTLLHGESRFSLSNLSKISLSILEKYPELVFKNPPNWLNDDNCEFFSKVFESDKLVRYYLTEVNLDASIFSLIPASKLAILEENIEVIANKVPNYKKDNFINSVTKNSKKFLYRFCSSSIRRFDVNLLIEEIDFVLEQNIPFSAFSEESLQNPLFIKKILERGKLEIIEFALGKGFDENILLAIEQGYDYRKLVKTEYFESLTFVKYLIDIGDNEFLLKNISIEQVLKYEDILINLKNVSNPFKLMCSTKYVRKCLQENGNNFKIFGNFSLQGLEDYTEWESFVGELYDLGFRLNSMEYFGFLSDPKLCMAYLKKSHDYNILNLIYETSIAEFEDVINYGVSLGYYLTKDTYNHKLKKNPNIIKNTILLAPIENFDYIMDGLTLELIEIAYERGYRLHDGSSFGFINNPLVFHVMLNKTLDYRIVDYAYCDLNEEDILLAIKLGYTINEYTTNDSLLKNKILIKNLLLNGDVKLFDKIKGQLDDEDIDLAFNRGYILTSESSISFKSSPYAIHIMLERYKDPSVIDLASCMISKEEFLLAIDLGYKITENSNSLILNNDKLMACFLEYKLIERPYLKEIILKLSKEDNLGISGTALVFDILSTNEDMINLFNINELSKIFRYLYFAPDSKPSFLMACQNQQMKQIRQIYDICESVSSTGEFNVITFKKIVLNYGLNATLCQNFIASNYTKEDILLLQEFVVNGLLQNGEINTLEDLRNYKMIRYESNKKVIDSLANDDLVPLKDVVFKILCNKNYMQIADLLNHLLGTARIDELLATLKNEDLKEELKNYRPFFELLEKIYLSDDREFLIKFANILNEKQLSGSRSLENIWNSFRSIDKTAKRFFGEEMKEKLFDFSKAIEMDKSEVVIGDELASETAEVVVRKDKYKTESFEYMGVTYEAGSVDLIELTGTPFVTFAHVLNAFGNGATVSDFKNPRLMGRTYICLSAISEQKSGTASRLASDMDHVTLLFSNFRSEQLAIAAEQDVYSQGEINNLELSSNTPSNLHPIREVINRTYENGYNEYVMYREDSQGNKIYPSAVMVTEEEPNEAEIRAALYLGVPLVKIKKAKYQSMTEIQITPRDISLDYRLKSKEEWDTIRESIGEMQEIVEEDVVAVKKI